MRGEIQAVNTANACNRAGIQQMIETTIKDHRFNPNSHQRALNSQWKVGRFNKFNNTFY